MTSELEAALLSAILGGVLGVIGTYVFDIRKSQRARAEREDEVTKERKLHRATVATALLQDLREIETAFRQLYDSETVTRAIVSRPRFYFDALKSETRWFNPESIYPLAECFRLVGQFYSSVEVLREHGGGRVESTPYREYEMRVAAGFILRTLPAAHAALVAEGGILEDPDPQWTPVTPPDLPEIPEPLFAQTRVRIAKRIQELPHLDS